ncbi:unnamed protein product [Cuscuta campestris]|uniref:Uncharacterized protein n=1 Tax=Cuscuta campestris TaxID=132261 RepID=A0A484K890_9ASTE|nr:unnamed protein product [Cuscuta campestris]
MFNLSRKSFPHLRLSAHRSSATVIKFYATKSGDESLGPSKKKDSFIVSYLVDRLGFAPEKALSASNYLKFETLDKPESVISFLKSNGFTETQISKLVRKCPTVILSNPQNTLLPKIDFFKSLGFTEEDYTVMLSGSPGIFTRGLENTLSPTVDFFKQFLSSPDTLKVALKRSSWTLSSPARSAMKDNVQLLMEMEVPESRIAHYLRHQPRMFAKEKDRFRKILDEVKGMGFDPSKKTFLSAVHVSCSMNKSTWKKKISVYKKWGLSEDEILQVFGKNPWIMACSEEKIVLAMDFLVNRMGFKASDILRTPMLIFLSLKKRIIPRCVVYQTLVAEGLLKNDLKLLTRMLIVQEKIFQTKYLKCYEENVPDLLKLYQGATSHGFFKQVSTQFPTLSL